MEENTTNVTEAPVEQPADQPVCVPKFSTPLLRIEYRRRNKLCTVCGKPSVIGRVMCEKHAESARKRNRDSYWKDGRARKKKSKFGQPEGKNAVTEADLENYSQLVAMRRMRREARQQRLLDKERQASEQPATDPVQT